MRRNAPLVGFSFYELLTDQVAKGFALQLVFLVAQFQQLRPQRLDHFLLVNGLPGDDRNGIAGLALRRGLGTGCGHSRQATNKLWYGSSHKFNPQYRFDSDRATSLGRNPQQGRERTGENTERSEARSQLCALRSGPVAAHNQKSPRRAAAKFRTKAGCRSGGTLWFG